MASSSNFSLNFFGSTDQRNIAGVSPEAHEKLFQRLDEALGKLFLTEAQKAEAVNELAKIKSDLEAIERIVAGFLQAICRKEVPPDQFAATLFKLIEDWRTAGVRIDALSNSRNLTPRVAALREAAQQAHLTGNIVEAIRLLDEIDSVEQLAEQQLLEHKDEIAAEINARRQGRIATKDAQISLALVTLDHAAAARLIAERIDLSEANAERRFDVMRVHVRKFSEAGLDKGVNAYLLVSVELARRNIDSARHSQQRGIASLDLGSALGALGEGESGNARLEEALTAFRAAQMVFTKDRAPLDWAQIQNSLGMALVSLGTRERGTARLEEAVSAYCAALTVRTRDRMPLEWAATQNSLGIALARLGEHQGGTVRLEEAVRAYRAALAVRTQHSAPREWAMTQYNLGNALSGLGERESGVARLEEAVVAFRSALTVRTQDKVPLEWAMTQSSLGNALKMLGLRESGTARLEEALTAHRAALKEATRDRAPRNWSIFQNNLGNVLMALGERGGGTGRFEEAVSAYRAALTERTQDRMPLEWAATQNSLGIALARLGEHQGGTVRLEEAVDAFRAAQMEFTKDRAPLDWAQIQNNIDQCHALLNERENI